MPLLLLFYECECECVSVFSSERYIRSHPLRWLYYVFVVKRKVLSFFEVQCGVRSIRHIQRLTSTWIEEIDLSGSISLWIFDYINVNMKHWNNIHETEFDLQFEFAKKYIYLAIEQTPLSVNATTTATNTAHRYLYTQIQWIVTEHYTFNSNVRLTLLCGIK